MKYLVSLEYLYHTTVEVDAETFADAVEKAVENPQIGTISERELEDPQPTWIQRELDGKEVYPPLEEDVDS